MMLREITIGQHFPGESLVHRMDPRLKILLTIAYVVMLFVGTNPIGLLVSALFLVVMYALAKIPAKMVWRSIRPLWPILLFTTVLNLFFVPSGNMLFEWGVIKITDGGIFYAVQLGVRIVLLIAGTGLLTFTTSPVVMTDAIERLLSPLRVFHFPAHELAMVMTIALRMIPTLIEETDKIMSAQKARGAELDSGNLLQRIKALVPVLIPLFISAFRRAEDLAMAMECRCYRGGEGRTKLKVLHISTSDIVCAVLCVCVFVLIGFSNSIYQALLALL